MGHRTARLLGGLGRTLITLGVLVVLFAGYQLWGTGLAEERAQDELGESFAGRRDAFQATSTAPIAPATTVPAAAPLAQAATTTVPPPPVVAPDLAVELRPELGETIGRIVMPTIGVDKYVVHGVRRSDLRRGPGHYPNSPLPGQAGNAAIAGHRTTYGAPFGDIDQLQPGDEIMVETLQGVFHYQVVGHPDGDGGTVGHRIVRPDAFEVLDDVGDNRLTLTACHPRYSAAQRIVVTALLVSPPAAAIEAVEAPPTPTQEAVDPAATIPPGEDDAGEASQGPQRDSQATSDPLGESLGWDTSELPATLGWGAVTAAVAGAVLAVGRAWRRWPAWLVGTPLVLLALFVTFGHLDRLLPAL